MQWFIDFINAIDTYKFRFILLTIAFLWVIYAVFNFSSNCVSAYKDMKIKETQKELINMKAQAEKDQYFYKSLLLLIENNQFTQEKIKLVEMVYYQSQTK